VKILLVDDDPFVREMLAMILEESGYEVAGAEDGGAAYDYLMAGKGADLIISDMNMPGMSGLDLVGKLRANHIATPFVILTGSDEVSIGDEALKRGADDYLLKDEDLQDKIVQAVGKVLDKVGIGMKREAGNE
jgi:CheY-like chemotaxis protein